MKINGDNIQTLHVNKGTISTVGVCTSETSGVLIPKGKENQIEQKVYIQENLNAPIFKGQKVGEITYTLDNEIIGIIDLTASNDITQISLGTMSCNILEKWFNLIR